VHPQLRSANVRVVDCTVVARCESRNPGEVEVTMEYRAKVI
jgi:hypothetical protein